MLIIIIKLCKSLLLVQYLEISHYNASALFLPVIRFFSLVAALLSGEKWLPEVVGLATPSLRP